MPYILGIIGGWIVSFFTSLTASQVRAIVVVTALITALSVAINALVTFVSSIVVQLSASLQGATMIGMFLPSNLGLCISIAMSVKFASTAYTLSKQVIEMKSRVN